MFRALLSVTPSPGLVTLLIFLSSSCFAQSASHSQAVILQYHHVSQHTPASTSISPQQFIKHLELIESQGFQVLPLPYIIQRLKEKKAFTQKTLAITFDDGYLSIYKNAFPELKKRQLPFTIFVSPQAIDRQFGNSLSWGQLKEMQNHGATVANHSYAHLHLLATEKNESPAQWLQRLHIDFKTSQQRLKDELSINNTLFAYPYGEFNQALKNQLKALGYVAFAQQSGPISASSDMQALPRFPASGIYANVETLKVKLNSLAFDIVDVQPQSRLLKIDDPAPTLQLRVKVQDVQYQQTQCFYMGSPITTKVVKLDDELLISAQLTKPLNPGRSRYNCTAPSLSKKCHYWYSMPFINQPLDHHWP